MPGAGSRRSRVKPITTRRTTTGLSALDWSDPGLLCLPEERDGRPPMLLDTWEMLGEGGVYGEL